MVTDKTKYGKYDQAEQDALIRAARREYQRQYYQANKEKIQAQRRSYWLRKAIANINTNMEGDTIS